MNLKKPEDLEFIENKLLEIRGILDTEDAYHICDTIVISINDKLLEEQIKNMLKTMGYKADTIKQISKIVKEIQA